MPVVVLAELTDQSWIKRSCEPLAQRGTKMEFQENKLVPVCIPSMLRHRKTRLSRPYHGV